MLTAPPHRQIDNNGVMIDPSVINPLEGRYVMELTPKEGAKSVYVSVPAAVLAGARLQNPDFSIDIEAPFGIFRLPADMEDRVGDLDETVLRFASFRVTLTDRSADSALLAAFKKSLPHAKAISAFVEFKLELIDTASKELLMPINDLLGHIEQLLPVLVPEFPPYYGVFRYNEPALSFAYAPHLAMEYGDEAYASVALTGSGVYVAAENQVAFMDLPANAWYTPGVLKAASKLLVRGVGDDSYEPGRAVTRAEFVQMIANALLLPETGGSPYADVTAGQWYYSAITSAKDLGLLDRFTEKSFYPNRPITREEMAVILGAVLRKCGFTSDAVLAQFLDSADMESDYRPDIALVFGTGLMMGVSYDKFDPKGVTTRAQAATVQIRLLETLNMIDK